MGVLSDSNLVGGPRLVAGTASIDASATQEVVDLSAYGGTAIKFAMGVITGANGPVDISSITYTTTATLTFSFTAVTSTATLSYVAFIY